MACDEFALTVRATRGLIAAPWTPASLSLCSGDRKRDSTFLVEVAPAGRSALVL